ncbi:MAG: hypothetical protein AAFV29_22950, partial [Myxococcota bacterium]
GRRIHDDVAVAQLMMRVAKAEVPSLTEARKGVPEGLCRAYSRATALVPQARFPTARDFSDALTEFMDNYDASTCQEALSDLALEALGSGHKKDYEQAVVRARRAKQDDLEGAILSALEEPDRVEPMQAAIHDVPRAERSGARTPPPPPLDDFDDEDVTEFDPVTPPVVGGVPKVSMPRSASNPVDVD